MKYIRSISDIHLDFNLVEQKNKGMDIHELWKPSFMETDKETVLVIPGDLWHSDHFLNYKGYNWLKEVAKQFYSVVFVLGNHDYWKDNISFLSKKIHKKIKKEKMDNVFFLDNKSIVIDNVCFIGSTLWTSFNEGNLKAMYAAENKMNDYLRIKKGVFFQSLSAKKILDINTKSQKFIFEEAEKRSLEKNVDKIVVVSHHSPSILSCKENIKNNDNILLYAYINQLENNIAKSSIDFWFHGHVHNTKEYCIENTRIIVNAKGYENLENTYYNERKLVDISNNFVPIFPKLLV